MSKLNRITITQSDHTFLILSYCMDILRLNLSHSNTGYQIPLRPENLFM